MIKPGIVEFRAEFIHVFKSLRRAVLLARVGVCCHLLNLSMDNSTVLGFSDTSGDYKGLECKYRTLYTRETLPRL